MSERHEAMIDHVVEIMVAAKLDQVGEVTCRGMIALHREIRGWAIFHSQPGMEAEDLIAAMWEDVMSQLELNAF